MGLQFCNESLSEEEVDGEFMGLRILKVAGAAARFPPGMLRSSDAGEKKPTQLVINIAAYVSNSINSVCRPGKGPHVCKLSSSLSK